LIADVAAWTTDAVLLLAPATGPLTLPVPATVLLMVLATDPVTVLLAGLVTALPGPLTALLTLVRTPLAGEAGDRSGLVLGAVLGAAPVLWLPPWPGMMSWVTARTAEAAALVAGGAGDCVAPPLDPAGGGAVTLAAGTLAAGAFAAGALAAGAA
jgi:hypothetical protein